MERHNLDPQRTYETGVNQFTDWTQEEFEAILGYIPSEESNVVQENDVNVNSLGSVDWASSGKVTAVRNQGSCGSCWSFSATAAVESAFLIKGTTTGHLSTQ